MRVLAPQPLRALGLRSSRRAEKPADWARLWRRGSSTRCARSSTGRCDVGRVQASAGTRAALDGLKLAESPRDISKISRLAAAKGGKTRAILKIAGRAA